MRTLDGAWVTWRRQTELWRANVVTAQSRIAATSRSQCQHTDLRSRLSCIASRTHLSLSRLSPQDPLMPAEAKDVLKSESALEFLVSRYEHTFSRRQTAYWHQACVVRYPLYSTQAVRRALDKRSSRTNFEPPKVSVYASFELNVERTAQNVAL